MRGAGQGSRGVVSAGAQPQPDPQGALEGGPALLSWSQLEAKGSAFCSCVG